MFVLLLYLVFARPTIGYYCFSRCFSFYSVHDPTNSSQKTASFGLHCFETISFLQTIKIYLNIINQSLVSGISLIYISTIFYFSLLSQHKYPPIELVICDYYFTNCPLNSSSIIDCLYQRNRTIKPVL
jgi:hypothetical protein